MTVSISAAPVSSRNPNDIFYQLENIDRLLDHDYMFETGSYLNYIFNPVRLNNLSGRLIKSTAATADSSENIPVSADNRAIIDENGNISGQYGFTGLPISSENIDDQGNFQLNVNNSDNIRHYYINQYAKDLKGLINDLIYNNPNILEISKLYNSQDPLGYINSYENFLLKLVNKLSALKGSFFLIDLLLKIYAKFSGQELISFMADSNNKFVYRVTSTLDVSIWKGTIKPFVHPLGWLDNYNLVDSQLTDLIFQPTNNNQKILANYKLKTISYLDAERYFINRSPNVINTASTAAPFYNYNGIEADYISPIEPNIYIPPVTGDYFGNLRYMNHLDGNTYSEAKYFKSNKRNYDNFGPKAVPFDDINNLRYKKFNLKPGIGVAVNTSSSTDYDLINCREFTDPRRLSFSINIDLKNNTGSIDLVYTKPGFATEYQWDIHYYNKLIKSVSTSFNKYSLDLKEISDLLGKNVHWIYDPTTDSYIQSNLNSYNSLDTFNSYDFLKNIRINLTIKYNKYKKQIYQYGICPLISRKDLDLAGRFKFWNKNYIGTRLKNTIANSSYMNVPTSNYNNISLENFISSNRNNTISYLSYTASGNERTDLFEYDQTIIDAIINSENIIQSNNDNNFLLTFRPILEETGDTIFGLIINYRWRLKYANILLDQTPKNLYEMYSKLNHIQLTLPKVLDQNNNLTVPVNNYFLELFVTLNNNIEYQVNTTNFEFVDSTIEG